MWLWDHRQFEESSGRCLVDLMFGQQNQQGCDGAKVGGGEGKEKKQLGVGARGWECEEDDDRRDGNGWRRTLVAPPLPQASLLDLLLWQYACDTAVICELRIRCLWPKPPPKKE